MFTWQDLGAASGKPLTEPGFEWAVGLGVSGAISIRPVGPRACKDAGSGWRVGVRVRVSTWPRDLGVRLLGKRRTRKDRRGDRLGAQVFPHPVPQVGLNAQALPDLQEVLMTRGRDELVSQPPACPPARCSLPQPLVTPRGWDHVSQGSLTRGLEGNGRSEMAPQAGQGAGWHPPLTRTACPGPRAWRTPSVRATRRGRSVRACALWAAL